MSKLVFYDVETTGLKAWRHGIHQLSGVIEIEGKVVEKFDFKMRPHASVAIDEEALKVSGITTDDFETFLKNQEAYQNFVSLLEKYVNKYDNKDKFHLVGYNNRAFDDSFLRAWFLQNKDEYFGSWFWSDSIDVLVLASWSLKSGRSHIENFKLHTIAKLLGIEVDENKLHNALYDVYLTREIYKII